MKKFKNTMIVAALCGSIVLSSCMGSFGMTKRLYSWNESISDKFVNELVFLAFTIVPVYSITMFIDGIILNSIEFWSGNNPMANVGEVKTVKGENGEFLVKTNEDGYTITKDGNAIDLVFNEEAQAWNVVTAEGEYELISMNEDGTVSLPNGAVINNDLMGAMAAKKAMN